MIAFDDTTADMLINKKINPIVTELFIRGKKNKHFTCFCYIPYQKNIRLNSSHYFIIKIPDKREVQQISFNHSSYIDFKDFMNLYKKFTTKLYFLSYCWGYFCIGFIDFMLKGKSLLDFTNLFSPNEYEKNDKIILKYFQ